MNASVTLPTSRGAAASDSVGAGPTGDVSYGTTRRDLREDRVIRLLVFTSLYPNAVQPRHGIFVEERLRHLVASGQVTATVMAPVPWFPFRSRRFGRYGSFARVSPREERHGIHVEYPRYPVIPKFGMGVAPALMYRALLPVLRRHLASGNQFDLIDAHYFYPDGVAAARLGQALGKPVVITARGSDVNVISVHRKPRWQIQRAAQRAATIVAVSQALKDKLVILGAEPGKIAVLRNGVDLVRFAPCDQVAIRDEMGLTGAVWLTVGHLIELKGVHIVIEALAATRGTTLLIAGDGPEKLRLLRLADRRGVGPRVRFLSAVPQSELPRFYNAADALLVASSSEGMPNVVLEALACGTPAVATPFSGVSEVVSAPEAGEVATDRTAAALVAAWARLQARMPERSATRRFAERFGWAPVVAQQCALYRQVMATQGGAAPQVATT